MLRGRSFDIQGGARFFHPPTNNFFFGCWETNNFFSWPGETNNFFPSFVLFMQIFFTNIISSIHINTSMWNVLISASMVLYFTIQYIVCARTKCNIIICLLFTSLQGLVSLVNPYMVYLSLFGKANLLSIFYVYGKYGCVLRSFLMLQLSNSNLTSL